MAIKKSQPLGDDEKHIGSENLFGDGVDAEVGHPPSVGEQLRLKREGKGYSLSEMANIIRLKPRQIQALEDGDYDALPGQTFVVGFLKSYANALGLDTDVIVTLYRKEEAGQLRAPQLAFPEPTSEGRKPGSNILIGTCIAAILAIGGWYYYLDDNKINMELVPNLPDQLAEKIKDTVTPPKSDGEVSEERVNLGEKSETSNEQVAIISDTPQTSLNIDNAPVNPEIKSDILSTDAPTEVAQKVDSQSDVPLDEVITLAPPLDLTEVQKSTEGEALPNKPKITEPPRPVEGTTVAETQPDNVDLKPAGEMVSETVKVPSAPSVTDEVASDETVAIVDSAPIVTAAISENKIVPSIEPEVDRIKQKSNRTDAFPQEKLDLTTSITEPEILDRPSETLGVQNTDARIVLMAHQDVWVQILSAGSDVVLERVLGAGDTYMLPDRAGLQLNTANAAGVEIRLDGEILGSIGGFGGIIRNLDLDPLALKQRFSVSQ